MYNLIFRLSITYFSHLYVAVELSNKTGIHRFVPWQMIDHWYVIYADSSSCNNSAELLADISYTIQLMNKDRQGHPVEHFSYEEAGKYK